MRNEIQVRFPVSSDERNKLSRLIQKHSHYIPLFQDFLGCISCFQLAKKKKKSLKTFERHASQGCNNWMDTQEVLGLSERAGERKERGNDYKRRKTAASLQRPNRWASFYKRASLCVCGLYPFKAPFQKSIC